MTKTINLKTKNVGQLGKLYSRAIKAAKRLEREALKLPDEDPRKKALQEAAATSRANASKIKIHHFRRNPVKAKAFDKAMEGVHRKLKATEKDANERQDTQEEGLD